LFWIYRNAKESINLESLFDFELKCIKSYISFTVSSILDDDEKAILDLLKIVKNSSKVEKCKKIVEEIIEKELNKVKEEIIESK